jgi:hypothetical protein
MGLMSWQLEAWHRRSWNMVRSRGLCVDVFAAAADGFVIAAGHNSRLQKMALAFWWISPARSRGFASILRLRAAVAS